MTDFSTLDPELAAAVEMLPKIAFSNLAETRTTFESLMASALAGLDTSGVELSILSAPGYEDEDPDVAIRFFAPESAQGRIPVLMWVHGGGFATGTAQGADPICIAVVRALGIAVASVEYRLAPETPFPGPVDDCYAALKYLHSNAVDLAIDPDAIAVGGQSAGGGLAAGTVLMARDKGEVPVAFQLLDIPELDDRLETTSMKTFVDTPVWNRANAILSWRYYLGQSYLGPTDATVSPYAAPSRATDLSGLPRTYISTMELDPLRDEGIAYALALLHVGVSVELHSFPGTFHGSSLIAAAVSQRQMTELIGALGRGLNVSVPAQCPEPFRVRQELDH
ncbi:alpha/beta hydrolase [Streptomyces sp. NPDC002722]|uniref:alpha/beta hydrolase n=1 Tax=Streptomyces sp. NPDC002722 TaxID=3154425 RepID=UPI00332EF8BA